MVERLQLLLLTCRRMMNLKETGRAFADRLAVVWPYMPRRPRSGMQRAGRASRGKLRSLPVAIVRRSYGAIGFSFPAPPTGNAACSAWMLRLAAKSGAQL